MKLIAKKLAATTLALIMLVSFSVLSVSAADTGNPQDNPARYTQKIVAVVYDESSSMQNDPMREPAARYSLEMLMSLLDVRDKMVIIPMNSNKTIEVDLAATDRNAELDRIMALPELKVRFGNVTPAESMGNAITKLESFGLKNSANLWDSELDKEYWMVILTDGVFGDLPGCTNQSDKVAHYIKDYPTLHTVYVGFGSSATDLSDPISQKALDKYQFTPYKTTEAELSNVIQQISNQMSGRYPLNPASYSVSGNKVTVDLNTLDFSLSSVSLIAQDCGATVKSVTYNGTTIKVSKPSVIVPDSLLGMKSGFSCEVAGNPFFMGGKLVFEFTAPVNPDKLSVFAEPALDISYYIECMVDSKWQRVSLQYINENLSPNDEIRVGYEVRERVRGELIDLNKTFGESVATVTYAREKFDMGQNIPLKSGVHELNIEVSVMDGAYILRDSSTCSVEDHPNYYRVEVDPEDTVTGTSAKAVYTVYVNNSPATKDILKDYTFKITAKDPEGNTSELPATVGFDGKITTTLTVKEQNYGVYNLNFEIKSQYNISRTKSHEVKYFPPTLSLSVSGSDRISLTQYDLIGNTTPFSFELFAGNMPFMFDEKMVTYRLLVDGTDVTSFATTDGNRLTYIPKSDNLGNVAQSSGDKSVVLTVEIIKNPAVQATQKASLSISKTIFVVESVAYGNQTIDRFNLKNTDAAAYFTIKRDGKYLSLEELETIFNSGDLKITDEGHFSYMKWLPCGLEYSIEPINGVPTVVARVISDMNTYFDWHLSALIFGSKAPVTASYMESSATAPLAFKSSSILTHIFRIIMALLAIWLTIHMILFFIGSLSCLFNGPFARPLPRGAFVILRPMGTTATVVAVNNTLWKRLRWHIQRLIPLPFFALHSQSAKFIRLPNELEATRSKSGVLRYKVNAANTIYEVQSYSPYLEELEDQVRRGKTSIRVSPKLFTSFTRAQTIPLPLSSQCQATNNWLGSFTGTGGRSPRWVICFFKY